MLMILQNVISASQRRVKMLEFAVKTPTDTRADARMITLETTAMVSALLLCIHGDSIFDYD